jgi:aminoglycoside phosphotransferase family enzyme/predicted kinase
MDTAWQVAALAAQRRLVTALADRLREENPAGRALEIVETHISWVVLAGEFAYKIKKPLNLGFLDFSSLDKRRLACLEEIRLNRRTAPDIYLDVVAIGGSAAAPCIGDAGPALEYAVRMHRFEREDGLDFLLARGALQDADIRAVATMIASFHAGAGRAAAGSHGTPTLVLADALANFSQMPPLPFDTGRATRLRHLHEWTVAEHVRLASRMETRARSGFVRECHGDLHLANMVRQGGRVVAFDCIEFNPEMRWIDVINDLAFTLMDLRHRGHADFARAALDTYLECSGDWAGVTLLPFYLTYRAMVRAKVAAFRANGSGVDDAARSTALQDCDAHLALAETFAAPTRPRLLITRGVAGSGKSHISAGLLRVRDWIRLRSDVERKRLAGLAALEHSGSALHAGLYSGAATARVYAHLATLADSLLAAGCAVIVDATFLKRDWRRRFRDLAARHQVPFTILAIDAEHAELERRIVARASAGGDASEADLDVLAGQLSSAEPIGADELGAVLTLDTLLPFDAGAVAAGIEANAQVPRPHSPQ